VEAILETHTSGSIKITLLTRHAHLTRLSDMITDSVVLRKLCVKIVSQARAAGLKKELKYTQ